MICIAICDDEKHMSDHIRSFVSDFFRKKNREISLRMFSSGEELLKDMVSQSFEVQAYDYLVKPVDKKQFEKTMERLYASMQNAREDSLLVQKGYEGCSFSQNCAFTVQFV